MGPLHPVLMPGMLLTLARISLAYDGPKWPSFSRGKVSDPGDKTGISGEIVLAYKPLGINNFCATHTTFLVSNPPSDPNIRHITQVIIL